MATPKKRVGRAEPAKIVWGAYRDCLEAATNRVVRLRERVYLEEALSALRCGTVFNSPKDLTAFRIAVRLATQTAGFKELRAEAVIVAACEIATNAIVYGGGGIGLVWQAPKHRVNVAVVDSGPGIPLRDLPAALMVKGWSSTDSAGVGLPLVLAVAQVVWLSSGPDGLALMAEFEGEEPTPIAGLDGRLLWRAT